jgi:hypothetical protein
MPDYNEEVIAPTFTIKNENETIPSTAWPKLTCGVANEVTFQDCSLKLGDQREVYFQTSGQLRAAADLRFLTGSPATEKLCILANGNVGIGTPAPENSEDWGRVLDLVGVSHAKLSVRTNAIDARVMVHENGSWGVPAGMVVGTKGNHSLSLATYAAVRMTILGDGRIGIGTTNPGAKLEINGGDLLFRAATATSEDIGGDIIFQNASGGQKARIWPYSGAGAGLFLSSRDNNPDIAIDASGRVGIGTIDPRAPLQVKTLTAISEGATGAGAWANIGSNAFFDGAWKRIDATKAGVNLHINADGGGQEFRFLRMEAGGMARNIATIGSIMSWIGEGNFGIGTASPQARLQVSGGAIMPEVGNNSQAGIQFPPNPGGGLGDEAFIRYFATVGETTKLLVGVGNDADDSIGFWQMGAERLTIANGRIGIGTTDPQGKLDVRGDIRAGNSDLYFTKTDHNHTGIGNATGFAAIENAADHGALMILGRAGTPQGRAVKLWDYLEVNGSLSVTGNVGIGTPPSPIYTLDVKSAISIKLGLEGNGGGQLILSNNQGDNKVFLEAYSSDGNSSAAELLLTGRWGTAVPQISLIANRIFISGELDVRGSIKLHTDGSLFAAGGVENLRILRGNVQSNGFISNGQGFTVNKNGEGWYIIGFNIPFPNRPSASVTPVYPGFDPSGQADNTKANAVITGLTSNNMHVMTGRYDGVAQNFGFSFIVVGLR